MPPVLYKVAERASGARRKLARPAGREGRKGRERKDGRERKRKRKEKENRSPKGNMWSAIPVALL